MHDILSDNSFYFHGYHTKYSLLNLVYTPLQIYMHHLDVVNDEVTELAAEWCGMCTALGLLNDDEIARLRFYVPKDCLKEVLRQWLGEKYDTERHDLPTWKKLVEAVAKPAGGSNPALAKRIAENHKKSKYI